MNDMAYYHPGEKPVDEVKIVKCKNCGADVTVNVAYPIDAVDNCKNCPTEEEPVEAVEN